MDLLTALWMAVLSYSFFITCLILLGIIGVYIFYKLCRQNTQNRRLRREYIENIGYSRV